MDVPPEIVAVIDQQRAAYDDFLNTVAIPDVRNMLAGGIDETEIAAHMAKALIEFPPIAVCLLAAAAILDIARRPRDA
jgi:hypothetical protein